MRRPPWFLAHTAFLRDVRHDWADLVDVFPTRFGQCVAHKSPSLLVSFTRQVHVGAGKVVVNNVVDGIHALIIELLFDN